jgi:hypothetical protein
MPSSITPATLTATITEDVILNGEHIKSSNTLTFTAAQVDKRIMTLPQGVEVPIVSFGSQVGAGTFVRGILQYLRITNKDTVNYARIRVMKTGQATFDVQVDAGKSFMMGNTDLNVSETAVGFATYVQADTILGEAYVGDIDIEYLVAST